MGGSGANGLKRHNYKTEKLDQIFHNIQFAIFLKQDGCLNMIIVLGL